MRSVLFSVLLATALSGCATVSMVASEATVETSFASQESSLSKVSNAYTEQAERKHWVKADKGLFGFARVLMDGASDEVEADEASYISQVKRESEVAAEQADFIRSDIESAAHGLDVATMEVEKLFETERTAKSLRDDLLSYETALVTAKKARRTFITVLSELEMADANPTTYALAQFDASIDTARDAADKLANYAADRRSAESTS
ncbi:MAG: hypothetical protein AAGL97_11865 [Pseudomonadota bacterium]